MVALVLAALLETADAGVLCWGGGAMGAERARYYDREKLARWEAKSASAEMRPRMPVSPGGAVVFFVTRGDIDEITGEFFTLVIEYPGREPKRYPQPWELPDVPPLGRYVWDETYVAEVVSLPVTVHFIDALHAHRCSVEVDERGRMSRVRE